MKKIILMLFSLIAITLLTCQQEEMTIIENENMPILMKSLALSDEVIEELAFGPEQFIRTKGRPNTYEVPLGDIDFECFQAPFVLTLVNGEENGSNRITSAKIYLDDTEIFGTSDFKRKVTKLEQEVDITESSILTVELHSKPGSYINIHITGEYDAYCKDQGTFIDERDNTIYRWVKIGNQIWMAENLKIGNMISGFQNPTDNGIIEKYCYDNNPDNCDDYGGLYQWNEMMQYESAETCGICPDGWHVPSEEEWEELIAFAGSQNAAPGKSLKSCRQVNSPFSNDCNTAQHPRWEFFNSSVYGTDDFGFAALPNGYRYDLISNVFTDLGLRSNWWSSKGYTSSAKRYGFDYKNDVVDWYNNRKAFAFAVRCVKD